MYIPYIGITDFMNKGQVRQMFEVFKKHLPKGSKRKLHVGVMMSHKTLNDIPSSWQKVFPPKETISDIFFSDEAYNCLHYADYDGQPDFAANLSKAIEFGGTGIHAVQLDMTWPEPAEIMDGVYRSRKKVEVILQIGKKALEEVSDDPSELVERLEDYRSVIDRVLLDMSMGHGLGMDADELLPFARAVKESFPDIGLVAAGGLGPETMHLVEPLVEEFPDLSIDAQGKLRPSGSNRDPIDWKMAEKYLMRAIKLLE